MEQKPAAVYPKAADRAGSQSNSNNQNSSAGSTSPNSSNSSSATANINTESQTASAPEQSTSEEQKLLLQICQAVMQSQIHQQAMPIRTRQKLQRVQLLIWQNLTIERKNKIWEQYISQPKPI